MKKVSMGLFFAGIVFLFINVVCAEEITDNLVKIMWVSGEVATVDANSNAIIVKGKKNDFTIYCDENTKITVGKEIIAFTGIQVGDKVAARFMDEDGRYIAKSIAIKSRPIAEEPAAAPAPESIGEGQQTERTAAIFCIRHSR